MSRIMVVTGVHLDRAWPGLGSGFGNVLRGWARESLARVVEEARQREVEAIVVLGNLMDRSTVLPETVEYAAAVLGSFPGPVLIAPGETDWIGDGGPYELGGWPANVHMWTSVSFEPAPAIPAIWGSAWTSPSSHAPRPPMEGMEGLRTLMRSGLTEEDLSRWDGGERVVTTGIADLDELLLVTDLVHAPGVAAGSALLISLEDHDAAVETITLPDQPGSSVDLDVTALETPDEFASAVKSISSGDGPILLRLTGELAARILLPGFGRLELAPDVVLDLGALSYAVEVAESSDRSARAEFLRAMALTRGDERERHQTTALGLEALSASTTGT